MSQRLVNPGKQRGLSSQAIRYWALLFVTVGVVGHAIIANKMMGNYGTEFVMSTIGAITQLIQICAVPLFAFLLVEGAKHTKCYWKYFLRVLGLALVSEIPFDLAYHGKWLTWDSQNPALALAVAMIMLYLFRSYAGKGVKTVLVNTIAVVVAATWVDLLRIEEGLPLILITTTFWLSRNKKVAQVFAGAVVTCLCSTLTELNLDYFIAPIAVIMIHFYNGEQGECNKLVNYAAYPVVMLGCWLFARFAL
jgi:hypothetical protein